MLPAIPPGSGAFHYRANGVVRSTRVATTYFPFPMVSWPSRNPDTARVGHLGVALAE
jgi:hypothetical protein